MAEIRIPFGDVSGGQEHITVEVEVDLSDHVENLTIDTIDLAWRLSGEEVAEICSECDVDMPTILAYFYGNNHVDASRELLSFLEEEISPDALKAVLEERRGRSTLAEMLADDRTPAESVKNAISKGEDLTEVVAVLAGHNRQMLLDAVLSLYAEEAVARLNVSAQAAK